MVRTVHRQSYDPERKPRRRHSHVVETESRTEDRTGSHDPIAASTVLAEQTPWSELLRRLLHFEYGSEDGRGLQELRAAAVRSLDVAECGQKPVDLTRLLIAHTVKLPGDVTCAVLYLLPTVFRLLTLSS